MKKFVIGFLSTLLLTASTAALAGPYDHGHRHYGHHVHRYWAPGYSWVVPVLIGGAAVYAATRPDTVIVQPAPVVVQNQYVIIDGITYRKEIMIVNSIQQEVLVRVQ